MSIKNRFRIGKVYLAITTLNNVIQDISSKVSKGKGGYICVSNPRTIVLASADPKYLEVMNASIMNIPDAEPDIWAARLWGVKEAERTMGPLLFQNMLLDKDSGIKHFLLGDTDETLEKILAKVRKERGSADNIVGMYSPPFCGLDEYDYTGMAKVIEESGADVVWVAMRAPKQDYVAQRLSPIINKKVIIGVGAAFRFFIGEYTMPPKIIKKLGLTGIWWGKKNQTMRVFLWDYLKSTVPYLFMLAKIPFKRIAGKKYYE